MRDLSMKNMRKKSANLNKHRPLVIAVYRDGLGLEQIARAFRCSSSAIRTALARWRVLRGPGKKIPVKGQVKTTSLDNLDSKSFLD